MGAVGANHIPTRSALRMKASSSLKNPVSEANSENLGVLVFCLFYLYVRLGGWQRSLPDGHWRGVVAYYAA